MFNKIKRALFLLSLLLLAVIISACGNKIDYANIDAKEYLSAAQKSMESPQSLTVKYVSRLKMSKAGEKTDTESISTIDIILEPAAKIRYAVQQLEHSANKTEVTQESLEYYYTEGGKYYVVSKTGEKTQHEEIGKEDFEKKLFNLNAITVIEKGIEDAKLVSAQKYNGKDVLLFEAAVAIGDEDTVGNNKPNTKYSYYIDEQTKELVGYIIDVTDMLNEQLPADSSPENQIEECIIECTIHNLNKVNDFDIPQ